MKVEETSSSHFQGALLTKTFREIEKNLKMSMEKPNHISTVTERSLYLNVSLRTILAVPVDVFFKKNSRAKFKQGIIYVDGWRASFNIL